ncbi:DNA topoisomerase IV [Aquimarina sp. AD10]|uniref:DNA topoisomerase IV n=1 Tax=Aquimarina aggregata TaxID=1642818 RepID=A0A162DLD9_9FLAO|nr:MULTISPECIES: DNA topoisomerase IV [Aquimarina]AXT59865.1 DNA topoisomerase IV [Aquimarina sp. AD10]KZS42148.1 DNA topoisomerase IV [Aquimarina aggregata]RKN00218.1 DNA topoisomerase IV [Aquimarina sp. AD10]
MKQIAFIGLLSLLFTSCYQQERNCTDFKTGTFEFETYLNGELVKTTFVRNDTLEIDYFQGKSDTSSIRWINPCEYIVKKIHPKNMAEEKAIHMKILSTDDQTYTFEYGLVGVAKNKQRGTAKKIK